jgi:hypothetical protein
VISAVLLGRPERRRPSFDLIIVGSFHRRSPSGTDTSLPPGALAETSASAITRRHQPAPVDRLRTAGNWWRGVSAGPA